MEIWNLGLGSVYGNSERQSLSRI
jgi:hypothetical protein